MTEPRKRRRWPRILLGVLAALVVLVVVAVLALDRILLSQVRKQTDALSRDLGRPVAVEDVKTKLLGGLGVKVAGVSIGAGPGEDVPLLQLNRAEVEADLLTAVLSGGKDVVVREAVVEGLRVNVVKLPDGTTNVERVSKALEERSAREQQGKAPQEPGGEPAKPADLSRIRVDRAAVENARIAFLDRTVAGAKELAVDDLDVEVKDLRAGRPLEVVLKAAVLAKQQNLELRMKAAPLPASLQPTPEAVTLKVQPIDLDPLAPFLPAAAGFRGGRFAADLTVALGAAVPGGQGKTRVQGGFQATQLAFAGQEGGKKLDASLAADLEADAEKGDLSIGKLDLAVGPVSVTGKGRASGLKGEAPRVEGLELVAHGLDLAALQAYYPPLRKQLGGAVVAGPIGLTVVGSGTGAAQRLELRVDLGPVRLLVPQQLEKAAGAPAALVAHADAAQGGERVRFDAALDLGGVDLRPGGTVAKKPGDPLSVKLAGSYAAKGGATDVDLSTVDVNLLGDRLAGRAKVALGGTPAKPTTRFDADLSGDRLDLDRVLVPTPKEKEKAKGAPGEASKPLDPKAFAGLSGVARMKLAAFKMQGVTATDVVVTMTVEEDTVTFDEARLLAFGGAVSAKGTQLRLAHPEAPFKVVASLKGVEGSQVLGLLSSHKVLGGTLDAAIELGGTGMKVGDLAKSVTGALQGNLRGGSFYGKDLIASVAQPIAGKLPFAASRIPEGGSTPLGKELPFAFKIADGVARLEKALRVDTGQGSLSLDGGVKLDGTLEMPATLALAPELVAKLTGGRAKPKEAIPVAFRLAGPAWSPRLEGLSIDGAVQAIAKEAAAGALGKALGVQGGSVDEVTAKKRAEAEAKAKSEADAARKKVEDEARKRLKGLFGK
jgi:AsmA protein